jgi:hypothetical protein
MKPKNLVNEHSKSELTTTKLRSYTGFENFTEEQALLAIQNIKRMAKILFSFYQNDNSPETRME